MLLTPCIVEGSTVIFYAKIFSECTISQPNLVAPIGNTEFMITKQLVWQNRSPLKCLLCNFQLNPLCFTGPLNAQLLCIRIVPGMLVLSLKMEK